MYRGAHPLTMKTEMTGEGAGHTSRRRGEFSGQRTMSRSAHPLTMKIGTVMFKSPGQSHNHAQDAHATSTPPRISPFGGGGTPEGVLGEDS